jgi:hypothetical protein
MPYIFYFEKNKRRTSVFTEGIKNLHNKGKQVQCNPCYTCFGKCCRFYTFSELFFLSIR